MDAFLIIIKIQACLDFNIVNISVLRVISVELYYSTLTTSVLRVEKKYIIVRKRIFLLFLEYIKCNI